MRQSYFLNKNLQTEKQLELIKNKLLKEKYDGITVHNNMVLFLDSIIVYKKYSQIVFKEFLDICEKYYKKSDIYNYIACVDKFESFIFIIPNQLIKFHYLKKKEFAKILQESLEKPKRKMIEMQDYIPYNLTTNQTIMGIF